MTTRGKVIAYALCVGLCAGLWLLASLRADRVTDGVTLPTPRADQGLEAAEFHKLKRVPPGEKEIPVEQYFEAFERLRRMPRYSTAQGKLLPSLAEAGAAAEAEEAAQLIWTALGPGNIGGRTRALLFDPPNPDVIYAAGVSGGVWKTTDGGSYWYPISDLLANIAVGALAIQPGNPRVIYAGTGEVFGGILGGGIFKTTDGGASWARLAGTSGFSMVGDLAVSASNPQRVYAAAMNGVWRSADGGANWTRILDQPDGYFHDLALRSDTASDVLFAVYSQWSTGQHKVYRCADAGGNAVWREVLAEAEMARTVLAIAPSNQNVIYAVASSNSPGAYNGGLHAVFRSTSGGEAGTWSARVRNTDPVKLNTVILSNPYGALCGSGYFRGQAWWDLAVAVDPTDFNRVWVGGVYLFRSDDGGANWGLAHGAIHVDEHVFAFHPRYDGVSNQIMLVGNDGGVYRTDNARGATLTSNADLCAFRRAEISWRDLNRNYGVTQFYHGLPFPDGRRYFGGTQDNGTILGTDDTGANGWRAIFGGDGGYVAIEPGNPQTLYVETQSSQGLPYILKSVDGGQRFTPVVNGITPQSGFLFIPPILMDPNNAQRLWTGGSAVWRTTDGAANWTQASAQLQGGVSALAIAPGDSNYALVGTSRGYVYRTSNALAANASASWAGGQLPGQSGYVSWLAYDPYNRNVVYATISSFSSRHVWKSVDGGANWFSIDGGGATGLPDIPVHCIVIDPSNTSRLYLGTDAGVLVTNNGGQSWAVENTGFANVMTESLALQSVNGAATLYAFTHGRGAWRVTLGGNQCFYTLARTTQQVGSGGASDSVNVTTASGCQWTATSNAAWITITSGASGSGNGTVNYSVATNTGASQRSGTMTIAGQTFTVTQSGAAANPTPSLTGINPNSATAGGAAFTLTINGSNFVSGAVVRWNGNDRTTTFVSGTQLTAQIPAANIAAAGTANVTVFNPAPGGGLSNSRTFTINPSGIFISESFNSLPAQASLNGAAIYDLAGGEVRLTPNEFYRAGSVFFTPTTLIERFTATFQLRIDGQGADGMTFAVIEGGANSLGQYAAGLGYKDIPGRSFAIEFDTFRNPDYNDPLVTPHIGLNVNGQMIAGSIATGGLPAVQGQGNLTVRVIFDRGAVQVFLPERQAAPALSATIPNWTPFTGRFGFTAATGGLSQVHAVDSVTVELTRSVANVSAASFLGQALASESIVAAFGADLATGVSGAGGLPLPTALLGTTVKVRDGFGAERLAPLFFVAPTQVNYQIPSGTALGVALVTITSGNGVSSFGQTRIENVAPGLMSANGNGQGVAAAVAVRVRANGAQSFEPVARFDAAQGRFVPIPIDLGPASEQVYLILYGTGFRFRNNLADTAVRVGGVGVTTLFAGAAPGFVGLDQINLGPIPRSLIGRGEVEINVTVEGKAANAVRISIR